MECRIYRSSDWFGTDKPCEGAYKKENDENWYVELENIEELKALNKEVKYPLMFYCLNYNIEDWEIEIHDE